jgi:hypothetical protein
VKRQATRRLWGMWRFGPTMSSELFYVCVFLPVTAIGRAIRPGLETELAPRRRWQVRLQEREQQIW